MEVQNNQTKIGQKEVGGVDMRGWRYRKSQNRTEGSGWDGYAGMEVQKKPRKEVGGVDMRGMEVTEKTKIGQKEVGGVDMRGWRYRKIKNQNRTEGSGWCGYAGMEVQKNPK